MGGGEIKAGTVLAGRYKIIRLLGEGGMGSVFLAEEIGLDRIVALKILNPKLTDSSRERRRFIEEARTMASFRHDNILEVYGIDEWKQYIFISMEYVDGESFKDSLDRGISQKSGLRVLYKTTSALAVAHEGGVIHRDLKPENILVGDDQVKVADWGLARAYELPKGVTKTGMVMGTPEYMAPEQISGVKLSPATDLYALGVLLYRLLSGRLPFRAPSLTDLLQKHLQEQAEDISKLSQSIDPYLADLTMQLLAKDPKERPQSAKKVLPLLKEGRRGLHKSKKSISRVSSPSKVAQYPSSAGNSPFTLPRVIASILSLLLVFFLFWHFASTEQTTVGERAFKSIRMSDFDEVLLKFSSKPPSGSTLFFADTDIESVELDTKFREESYKNLYALRIPLEHPIFEAREFCLKLGGGKEIRAKLEAYDSRFLRSLKRLEGMEAKVIDALNDCSNEEEVNSVLSNYGLDQKFSSCLEEHLNFFLPKGKAPPPSVRRLFAPLIWLETCKFFLQEYPPWGSLSKHLGYEYEFLERKSEDVELKYPRPVEGRVLARVRCKSFVTNEEGHKKRRQLWIHSPEQVKRAKESIEQHINFTNWIMSFCGGDYAKAVASDWQAHRERSFRIDESKELLLREARLRMVLDLRFFTDDRVIEVAFNEKQPYYVHRPIPEQANAHEWLESSLRVSLPLSSSSLRVGENRVVIKSRLLVEDEIPLNGSRFEGFAIVVAE